MIICSLVAGILLVLLRFLPKTYRKYWLIVFLGAVCGVLVSLPPTSTIVRRNTYGGGSRTETYLATVDGEKEKAEIQIEIHEKQYSKEKVEEFFQEALEELELVILGENQTKDHVERDLNLVRNMEQYPFEITWELDRYDVLDVEGHIIQENRNPEGTLVKVTGHLSYASYQAVYETYVNVVPRTKTAKEQFVSDLQEAVKKESEAGKESDTFSLPNEIGGKKIYWSTKTDSTGYYLLVLGVVFAGVSYYRVIEKQKEREQKIKRQMMQDYPEILNQLTLLLDTGMTVRRAWCKIVEQYEEKKMQGWSRYAYEEMCVTRNEMNGGVTEMDAYERFGKRCGLLSYMKLGATLSQNLRKGSKGLTQILSIESIQAFELRKQAARKNGEEASTKLLLPMFGMLAIVLVIIVIPAFFSIQI